MRDIVSTFQLTSNKLIKFNFDGGDLTSDAGLLLIKEFAEAIGLPTLVRKLFKTNDSSDARVHTDDDNLLQAIYMNIAAYFQDDHADHLSNEAVMTSILDKERLASQPTLSRFYNRMDSTTRAQLEKIMEHLRDAIYIISKPETIVLDIDSTLLNTYGKQEGAGFNYHYQAEGYHPLVVYDSLTRDLIRIDLRDGTEYCSKNSGEFLEPVLKEYRKKYADLLIKLRGDSGFAAPEVYEVCEKYQCKYAIRLKENAVLHSMVEGQANAIILLNIGDAFAHVVEYGEFMYKAKSWSHERRVVYKLEKKPGEAFTIHYTFIVTTLDDSPEEVIKFYCGRGEMENFIKEGKNDFDFKYASSHSREVNANRLLIHALAYNLFNWFRRLVLPKAMQSMEANTIRMKLMKIAARRVSSGRYQTFRLCSNCPYQEEFIETFQNIQALPRVEANVA